MALPKLNDVPMYTMTVPSTGKEVKYRPFLVKEQKVLLIANESRDKRQILMAMLNTIQACVKEEINVSKLPTFDIDYMFTQIRAKSVGENAELVKRCSECEKDTIFTVDLSKISPPKLTDKKMEIRLTDNIKVSMNYPSYSNMIENEKLFEETDINTDFLIQFLLTCMHSIQTEEESILLKDETEEEKVAFIDSLSAEQFEKLSQFLQDMPKITHNVEVTCEHCGNVSQQLMEGIEDFF